jgi:hypothetical protein
MQVGATLGAYEILAKIGEGGMGEVYRARDTRLNRDVALKILPPHTADNPTAFARFQREAQAVAALSHPNILAVHDFGRTETTSYVVFELLRGISLRDRLAGGPLPVRKAVEYGRQIADGLAVAHAQRITHRDIKPDNLFVTDEGRVKILDFGLADTPADAAADESTITRTFAPETAAGILLGTMGYMAPEQLRAQPVDHRADIFALGVTVYEMCSGQRPFRGATPADIMSAVLTADAPELVVPGQATPPGLDRIVRRCLEKSPGERFQSARDLSFALDGLSNLSGPIASPAESGRPAPGRTVVAGTAVAALLTLAAGMGVGRYVMPSAPTPVAAAPSTGPSLRAEFGASLDSVAGVIAVSPDGRRLVHGDVDAAGVRRLVVRDLMTGLSVPIPDSELAVLPTWSPRSDAVLYQARGEIRIHALGEPSSRRVDSVAPELRGVVWLADDTLILCLSGAAPTLRRMKTTGERIADIALPGDVSLSSPRAIGRRTDYVIAMRDRGPVNTRELVLVHLVDGTVTKLADTMAAGASADGYIFAVQSSGLVAIPFDRDRLVVTGGAVRIPETVDWEGPSGLAALSATDGVLAIRNAVELKRQFEWIDARGRPAGSIGTPDYYGAFALSPNRRQIVARLMPGPRRPSGLHLIDIERGVTSSIAAAPGNVSDPVWTADGTRIVYRADNIVVRQSPAAATGDKIYDGNYYPDSASADGRWLVAGRPQPGVGFRLFLIPLDRSGEAQALSPAEEIADEGAFSPDGRFVAFHSARKGPAEVYVTRFPATGEMWQVSAAGGVQPRWSLDGRSLHYLDPTGNLMRVAVSDGSPPRFGRPETLFNLGVGTPSVTLEQYSVGDGRFLVLRAAKDAAAKPVVVLSNWTSILPRPAPGP